MAGGPTGVTFGFEGGTVFEPIGVTEKAFCLLFGAGESFGVAFGSEGTTFGPIGVTDEALSPRISRSSSMLIVFWLYKSSTEGELSCSSLSSEPQSSLDVVPSSSLIESSASKTDFDSSVSILSSGGAPTGLKGEEVSPRLSLNSAILRDC